VLAGVMVTVHERARSPSRSANRDFRYGTSATAGHAMKPQNKLCHTHDNVWRGSLFNRISAKFEIRKFDRSLQSWRA
jgi:hypothetical protein